MVVRMPPPPSEKSVPPPLPGASGTIIDQSLPCVACGADLRGQEVEGVCTGCGTPLKESIVRAGFVLPTADAVASPLSKEPPPIYVQTEQTCMRCGYSLRGLAADANCPECGSPVIRSLRGNLLRYTGPEYLRTIYTGSIMVQAGALGGIGVGMLAIGGAVAIQQSFSMTGFNIDVARAILGAATSITVAFGWWLFASPDPGWLGQDTSAKSRLVLRISSAASAVFHAVFLVFVLSGISPNINTIILGGSSARSAVAKDVLTVCAFACYLLKFAAGVVVFFSSTMYIQQIARRVPDVKLYKDAKQFMWAGPILYVFCAGLGGIITFAWQMVLVNKCGRAIKNARKQAETHQADPSRV